MIQNIKFRAAYDKTICPYSRGPARQGWDSFHGVSCPEPALHLSLLPVSQLQTQALY